LGWVRQNLAFGNCRSGTLQADLPAIWQRQSKKLSCTQSKCRNWKNSV